MKGWIKINWDASPVSSPITVLTHRVENSIKKKEEEEENKQFPPPTALRGDDRVATRLANLGFSCASQVSHILGRFFFLKFKPMHCH